MIISKGTVVSIDYTLKDDEGNVLDSSQEDRPLMYLQGAQNIIPGLEKALEGKSVGEQLDVRVSPEEGYGTARPEMVQIVPKDRFEGMEGEVEVGMQFHARNEEGGVVAVRVVKVENDEVTIDGNHPLADTHLNFSVKVADIRIASEEELAQGRPEFEGGCCGGQHKDEEGHCGEGSCGCSH
jgi:FKBP-type peptidyl-prolyl cis-trans isomerase SlyD